MGAFPLYSLDAYGHLAQGRQIAQLGRVPEVDPFSFWKPSPAPWSNYEWAYDLLSWLLYDRFGPNALILIKCILLALLGYVLVLLAIRLAKGAALAAPLAATIAILFAPLARIRFTIRPQIIGLVLPAVLLLGIHALYSERSSSRTKLALLFGLGAMQLAWVNLHGSHLLGLLITSMFLLFSMRTGAFVYMMSLLIVQTMATFCTPFGVDIVSDAISHVFRPEYRELVTEWSPWSPGHPLYLLLGPAAAAILCSLRCVPWFGGVATEWPMACFACS